MHHSLMVPATIAIYLGGLTRMRIFRFILAVLVTASLVILPVSATVTMGHPAKAEMAMSAGGLDCPCCNAIEKCQTDKCTFNCLNAPAIAAEGPPLLQPPSETFVDAGSAALLPFLRRPDPPPPRS